jgi:hypothetical protein
VTTLPEVELQLTQMVLEQMRIFMHLESLSPDGSYLLFVGEHEIRKFCLDD